MKTCGAVCKTAPAKEEDQKLLPTPFSSMLNIYSKYRIIFLITLVVVAIKTFLFLWAGFHFNFTAHPGNNWVNIWDRWDAGVYKTIATSSYNLINIKPDYGSFLSHFLPLYSVIMAMVSWLLTISLTKAGILVSTVSIIAASIMLYKLVYLDFKNERVAWLSVLFLNFYPTSYFTISVYSESLFLLLVITGFYCLRKEYFFISGLAAAGAILTRIVGIVFLPIYALYFFYSYKKHLGFNLKIIYPFLLSLAALVLYFIINKFYYGDYFYFLTEKVSFNTTKHLILPLKETFFDLLAIFKNSNFLNQEFMTTRGWNAIFTLFALVVTAIGIRKINWVYSAYSLSSILIFSSLSWGISNARYTLSAFPIFIVLAFIKSKILLSVILVVSGFMLLYFTKIFTSGAWAF